jgi:hypothetical protein
VARAGDGLSGVTGGVTGPHAAMLRLAYGAQAAQIIYVAAKLGLADLLHMGPRTAADLAAEVGINAPLLQRVLRALVSLEVCTEMNGDAFALTETGQYLRVAHPDSVRSRSILNTEVLQPLWGELLHTIQTGQSGAERVLGMPLYQYLPAHPEIGALFDQTMAAYTRYRVGPVVAAYDFAQFDCIVDVGGGSGALLIEILRAYPKSRGIVFDLPAVADRARETIAAAGLADRCTAVGGSALDKVPQHADAYVLSNFLVTMDDERAAGILRHCRAAMAPGGRVLLVEWVAGSHHSDPFMAWDTTSIDMAILSTNGAGGGRVRTADEFRTVLAAGGFSLTAIVPTTSSVSIIEAQPTKEPAG